MSNLRFNPPPNWPVPPAGWTPPPGWEPDPAWGPAPFGWQLWVDGDVRRPQENWFLRHKVISGVAGGFAVLIAIGAVAGGSSDKTGSAQKPSASTADLSAQTAAQPTTPAPAATHALAKPKPTRAAKPKATKVAHAAPASRAAALTTWAMPQLVGKDLQTAQDAIQALTTDAVWFTDSHDVSGQDRGQWLDSDWQVCTQNIRPGARFGRGANIDFGVVKAWEQCP